MNIVLASGSPRRAKLLADAGVEFEIVVPGVSEEAEAGATPERAAEEAARRKCEAVAVAHPESPVLAADTLVVVDGRALGKPLDLGEARAMLRALSGRSHSVVTAVCIDWRVRSLHRAFSVESKVRFQALSDEDIEAYLAAVEVLDKAGAYAVQERADLLGAKVRGSITNVVGLPVAEVLVALREMGLVGRSQIPHSESRIPHSESPISNLQSPISNRPSPIPIGSLVLRNPFLFGGLSGYSDRFIREACLRFGAAAVVTPMMLDKGVYTPRRHGPPPPAAGEAEHPVIAQLLGETPSGMARAAEILEAGGFDALEINMACPSYKILRRGRGGALLKNPALAIDILKAVREIVRMPLLVKIRRGYDETPEAAGKAWALLEGALAVPVDAVTIHPRTAVQKYKGPSDWAFLAEARRRFPGAVLIGSGDLFTPGDALRMLRETGISAVAFGRGAIANPWIFRQAAALLEGRDAARPSGPELLEYFDAYKSFVMGRLPERSALNMLRKECIQASRHVTSARKTRTAFARAKSPGEFDALMREIFLGDAAPEPGGDEGTGPEPQDPESEMD